MSTNSFQSAWGSVLIGFTICLALYGVGLGQFIFYLRAFPQDLITLKALVIAVFILDSAQILCLAWAYHHLLIICRLNPSPICRNVPITLIFSVITIFFIPFIVQSFYAQRVWIISGQNRLVTSAVMLTALAQLLLGLACVAEVIHTPTFQVLSNSEFSPLAALASAACDAIITGSIVYYLRPSRTGINRRGNYIKKLNLIFVQMGLLTLINAASVAILYLIQDHASAQQLTAAPGLILGQTYMNSMFSVLNARRPIREAEQARAQRTTVDLPTIPTIR